MDMAGDLLAALSRQNIWWEGRVEDDYTLRQWKGHPLHWTPMNLASLSLEPFSLNLVFGPRQAGKTTLLKFAVQGLLSSGEPAKSILYLRCDEIAGAPELREVLQEFLSFAGQQPVFIFIDEASEVKGWEKMLKGFIDDGALGDAVVTVSGSNAFQLQRGSELFPGRRGKGRDSYVLPLTFREFLRVCEPELSKKIPRLEALNALPSGAGGLMAFLPRLQKRLLDFFECGGFPLAVLSYLKDGYVSEAAKEAYKSWVIGDVLKNGKSDVLAREVMKVILSKAPSPVSWEGIAQETSIKSPPTVASYADLFERLFVLLPLHCVNPNNGAREFAKNKKLLLLDPFLWTIFGEWCLQPLQNKAELLAESCLSAHLARFLLAAQGGRRLSDNLSYWRNGHELDAVAHTRDGLLGFESKWSDRKGYFKPRVGPIKGVTYVSRGTFKEGRSATIPLALFLAML